MDAPQQKLEVIRKLLTKAERAATPDEADAYNAKAAEMMARHGVDSAMVAASSGVRDEIGTRRIAMTDPYSKEKAQLASYIGRALGCRAVQHQSGWGGRIEAVTLLGFRSDLDRVELTFTSLLLQATRSVVQQRPPSWSGESTAAFRRTWMVGFSNEVFRRLTAAETAAVDDHDASSDGPSAALVIADRRSLVDRAFDEQYGHLGRSRPRRLSGSGYAAGAEAGRRADVGHARVSGVRRSLER